MDNVKKYVDSENSLGPDMEATTALLVPNFWTARGSGRCTGVLVGSINGGLELKR